MKNRIFAVAALLSVLALFLSGCASWFYKPVYVISLHEFEDQRLATGLVVQVKDRDYRNPRSVKRFPFLDSRSFYRAELTGPDEEGRYGVRLYTTRWSVGPMRQAANSNYGQIFAVVVDGMYAGTSQFNREMCQGAVCELAKLWTKREAELIVSHVEANYKHNSK